MCLFFFALLPDFFLRPDPFDHAELVSECQQDGVTLTPVILPGEPSTGIASPSPNPPQGGSSSQGPSQGPSQSPSRSPSPSSSRSSSGASASTPPSAPKSSNPSASQQSSQSTTNSIQTVPSILPTPTSPSSTQSNDANLPSNTAPPASPDTNSADRIVFTTPLAVAIFGIILVLAWFPGPQSWFSHPYSHPYSASCHSFY